MCAEVFKTGMRYDSFVTSPDLGRGVLSVLKHRYTMCNVFWSRQLLINAKSDADAWVAMFADDVVDVNYEMEICCVCGILSGKGF